MLKNSSSIMTAFKNNLDKRKAIIEMQGDCSQTLSKLNHDINTLKETMDIVFKNFCDRRKVVQVEDMEERYYRRSESKKRWLFINSNGFSVGSSYDDTGESKSAYIQKFTDKAFMMALRRVHKYKGEIAASIPNDDKKDDKKEVFLKFIDNYEKSEMDKQFPYDDNFDEFELQMQKDVHYYDNDKITSLRINNIKIANASNSITIPKIGNQSSWGGNTTITFDDLEKVEQMHEELTHFLTLYKSYLEAKHLALDKFNRSLNETFAKEIIAKKFLS
jgi:hypothetical protein